MKRGYWLKGILLGALLAANTLQSIANELGCQISSGQVIDEGSTLHSNNQRYSLVMQHDGNLVLYDGGQPVWASNTSGGPGCRAVFQGDGNFVVYRSDGQPLWSTQTAGRPVSDLCLQDDGNLVIYYGATSVWTRFGGGPAQAAAPPPQQQSGNSGPSVGQILVGLGQIYVGAKQAEQAEKQRQIQATQDAQAAQAAEAQRQQELVRQQQEASRMEQQRQQQLQAQEAQRKALEAQQVAAAQQQAQSQLKYGLAELAVVTGEGASAPSGYQKIGVDLNRHAGGQFIYLCYRYDSVQNPIVALETVRGENPPAGFQLLRYNLNAGCSKGGPVYLCYRRSSQEAPVTDIRIVSSSSENEARGEGSDDFLTMRGWYGYRHRVQTDLNASVGGDYIFLFYKLVGE